MRAFAAIVIAAVVELSLAGTAAACPTCGGDVRKQVWAGVFNSGFSGNLLMTAAPFVILLGLAAAIHGSGPERVTVSRRSGEPDATEGR